MSARFRFTPSVLDGETLEALFVARHGILDTAVDAVREAAAGEHRAHQLFVGPRGAGKTHLIALIHHRLLALRADGLRVQPAWLVEDPWDIGSYAEFLEAVLDALPGPTATTGGDAEARLLTSVAADGPVVVLAENFDRILTAIGSDGQRRLRALLENSRPLLLMATATRLSDEVARQDEPFYGFFSVTHLEPFGVEDAAAMLIALAKHEQDQAQLELLARPEAARRLATIAHLAGGQPRVWALLGPALQTSGIEDLVTNLLGRVDDLTPYYQEQLAHLSPQEARVVRLMAKYDRPLTVRGIAELAGLDQRSVGKTISDLRRRGWIRQYSSAITDLADKRHSYYVLAEPLARLAFQVKESRGEPIQLVVEFIAAWHEGAALTAGETALAYIAVAAQESKAQAIDVGRALSSRRSSDGLEARLNGSDDMLRQFDDALLRLLERDPSAMLELPATLISLVDHELSTGLPLARLRARVAGVATDWAVDWRGRMDDVESGDDLLMLATQEFVFGTVATLRLAAERLELLAGEDDRRVLAALSMLGIAQVAHRETGAGLSLMGEISRRARRSNADEAAELFDKVLSSLTVQAGESADTST